jgi:hypothetical protein
VEETSVLLFLNKFDVTFFSTCLHLIGLFFWWPHFVGFGSLKRYLGIAFVGEKSHFSILFGFPFGVCKTSKEKLKY